MGGSLTAQEDAKVRKEFNLDDEQSRRLEALALATGPSEEEIIRESLGTILD